MKKRTLAISLHKDFPEIKTDMLEKIIEGTFKVINEALLKREKVTLYRFGEFYVTRCKVNHVYDFRAGKSVPFSGKDIIKFRASPTTENKANKGLD